MFFIVGIAVLIHIVVIIYYYIGARLIEFIFKKVFKISSSKAFYISYGVMFLNFASAIYSEEIVLSLKINTVSLVFAVMLRTKTFKRIINLDESNRRFLLIALAVLTLNTLVGSTSYVFDKASERSEFNANTDAQKE